MLDQCKHQAFLNILKSLRLRVYGAINNAVLCMRQFKTSLPPVSLYMSYVYEWKWVHPLAQDRVFPTNLINWGLLVLSQSRVCVCVCVCTEWTNWLYCKPHLCSHNGRFVFIYAPFVLFLILHSSVCFVLYFTIESISHPIIPYSEEVIWAWCTLLSNSFMRIKPAQCPYLLAGKTWQPCEYDNTVSLGMNLVWWYMKPSMTDWHCICACVEVRKL